MWWKSWKRPENTPVSGFDRQDSPDISDYAPANPEYANEIAAAVGARKNHESLYA
jgi:hypothetical protein